MTKVVVGDRVVVVDVVDLVVSKLDPEVMVVKNPGVVVIVTSVTGDVGVKGVVVVVIEPSVGFNIAIVVPLETVLFLIVRRSMIVVTIVMMIIVMLKTAQNLCPLSKYFQNPNIARPDKLAVPPN